MSDFFTKSDLKNGDVIIRRNGNVEIVCVETQVLISTNGVYALNRFLEDLTDHIDKNFDIIDVYRPTDPSHCSFSEYLYKRGKHVFHRDESPIEVTIDEIAKLKGVSADRIKNVK